MRSFIQQLILIAGCFLPAISIWAGSSWQSGVFQVEIEKSPSNIVRVSAEKKTLLEIDGFQFDNKKVEILKEESANPNQLILNVRWGHSEEKLVIAPVKNGIHFTCSPKGVKKVTVILKDQGEHFFGVMEKLYPDLQRSPDLRGVELNVKVNGNGGMESAANAWSAFYMSSLGYGSFFDTFAKGTYRLGMDGQTTLMHRTGKLNWYIFYGPTGDKIDEGYFSVIGAPKKVPLWALGPTIWKDNWDGKKDILDTVEKFAALKIPTTQLMVDRPYSDGANEWGKMNFSPKFQSAAEWIKTLQMDYDLRVSTWVAPLTWGDPCEGCWKTGYFYIDLSDSKGVRWYKAKIKQNQHDLGVSGHKMDRGEEKFSDQWEWHDGTPPEERNNKYLFLNAKVTHEMLAQSFGEDQFNYARGAYHRVQPYLSALWGGDVETTWDGMANNLANAVRCGFMGFPLWGSDVTGYKGGSPPDDLCIRWLEWGAWSGFFEIKLDDSMPSDRPDAVQEAYRNAANQRMELLPYLYSLANSSAKNGVLMKPMAYLYPQDSQTYSIWDQYLLGPSFLVAPILQEGTSREVYFPAGKWFDFYDPTQEVNGGARLKVQASLSKIPVYIKQNSIYLTGSIYRGSVKKWMPEFEKQKHLIIHAFPGELGEENTFTYVDALDRNKEKAVHLGADQSKEVTLDYGAMSLPGEIKIRLTHAPKTVTFNGKAIENVDYDKGKMLLTIPFAAHETVVVKVQQL